MKYSRKGMKRTTKLQVTKLRDSRRGANKRGTCAHKRTKGARYEPPFRLSDEPRLRMMRWGDELV